MRISARVRVRSGSGSGSGQGGRIGHNIPGFSTPAPVEPPADPYLLTDSDAAIVTDAGEPIEVV